jgi:protein-glutamine gamma-glutamyltransferase
MNSSMLRPATLREQLSRGLPRDKSDTLLLIGACALVMMPHAWHLPGWVTVAACGLLLWRGWITFHGNRMPARWLLLVVAALLMLGVYNSYRTFLGREAGVCMLTLLLALKLLEMRARRDLFVVTFLSFFVLLTNFFYSQSIATALLAAAGVIAILTAQISFQFTGVHPPLRERVGMALRIFLLAAPLTIVLFLFFPRIQGPLWGMPADAVGSRTGLSDSMEPGNISELALSPEIAFRVRFIDAVPASSALYWRGPVLGNYDGRRWTPLTRTSVVPSRQAVSLSPPLRYQVTQEPSGRHSLFALDLATTAPRLEHNPVRIQPDFQIIASQAISQRVRYDAESSLDYRLQADESTLALRDWMDLPPAFNPRTHEYATQLRAQATSDLDLVNAVLRMFRTRNFSYTLRPPPLGRHAVDDFLFSTRAGFCEHYAGAFVVLMRILDIPARVVTGYQGGELNKIDGYLIVRQSDAHAWAEVWLSGRGWVRVDPTAAVAPDRIERNLASALPQGAISELLALEGAGPWLAFLQKLRDNRDAMNNAWNQWVLDYTPARQHGFLQSLGIDDPDWGTLTVLALTLGAAVTALVALPLVRNRQKTDPVEVLYRSFCSALARQGLPRATYEGPLAYRIRLQEAPLPPVRRAAALRFLELYEILRYGTPEMLHDSSATTPISQLKSLLAQSQ